MPATLWNAPARPLLTILAILALSLAIATAAALPSALRAVSSRAVSASAHPRFERRMPSLRAIVVTAPDTAVARAKMGR
ncbi:MAG TPA: hypothetical protein VHG93_18435 [Longimicrobium sp.]|nr:hypothetical protein [Longimicrobium sp.]